MQNKIDCLRVFQQGGKGFFVIPYGSKNAYDPLCFFYNLFLYLYHIVHNSRTIRYCDFLEK